MQKQLFGAVLASTFLLVGCCDDEKCETMADEYGTTSSITSPLPDTEIDTQKGSFTVICNIKNFTPDKADGKFFWISIEDVKQAKHWPKFPVEDEQCSPNIIYEGQKNDPSDKEHA